MRDALWAEWLIARFTERSRASCIVGDILESNPDRGVFWFWLTVVEIILSLNWRPIAAFLAAFLCLCSLRALPMPMFAPLGGGLPADHPPDTWRWMFAILGWLGALLWVATPYCLLRYGLRDKLGQLAFAFCVPITLNIFFWRASASVALWSATGLVIFISSLIFARWRRALLALVAALIVGYGGIQALIYLADFCRDRAFLSASLILDINGALPFFGAAVLTFACGWMHQRLLQRRALAEIPR